MLSADKRGLERKGREIMRNFFIVLLIIAVIIAAVLYINREEIIRVSAENFIKSNLPSYLEVEGVSFNMRDRTFVLKDLKVKNPTGFSDRFLADIGKISCSYGMQGNTFLNGIEVKRVSAENIDINIQRLENGRININSMSRVMEDAKKEESVQASSEKVTKSADKQRSGMNIEDILKFSGAIDIKNGKVIFTDYRVDPRGYRLSIDDVNGTLDLGLKNGYSKVVSVKTQGSGVVNGNQWQNVSWILSLDPTEKQITMSSRFEVSGLDITLFEPYYKKYSPVIFDSGIFSGTLVFDFDHGNIGSTNTLVLKGLKFREKKTEDGAASWQKDMVPDIVKYLSSAPDELTFDFKIKGTVNDPVFYPGPRVKEAIQGMVVDKIAGAIRGLTGQGDEQQSSEQSSGNSDVETVINVMRGLFNE